jgi:hypothetical protein
MVAPQNKMSREEISETTEDPGKFPKTKFGILGKEIVEKEVKKSGNSGRVYLPSNWVGEHVKIIRID